MCSEGCGPLTVRKDWSPHPELCKGQLDRVHQLLEGQSHASPLLLQPISHTMGTVCFKRGGTATNVYREDTAATFSLILSNSLSLQNHSAGTKGIHSEQKPNSRSIRNKNIYKHTKYTLKLPHFHFFHENLLQPCTEFVYTHPMTLYCEITLTTPYVMTGRNTVVYHF